MSVHPLQSSGAIAISDLVAEFAGTDSLSAYYRGGSYVPNRSWNSAVPTSGAISLADFYGTSAYLYYGTMTVGASGTGYHGFSAANYGSVSPIRDVLSDLIESVISQDSNSNLVVQLYTGATNPGSSYFSAVYFPTISIHAFFNTSAAVYSYSNPLATWTWTAAVNFNGVSSTLVELLP